MEKPTFKEAIQRFVHVGEVYFRGHYHDNVLNIFNELTEEDRKVLLRNLYLFYILVEKGVVDSSVPTETGGRRSESPGEAEVVNKMTASSTLIIVMLIFFIIVMSMLFLIVGMDSSANSAFKNLFKVIGFFFG